MLKINFTKFKNQGDLGCPWPWCILWPMNSLWLHWKPSIIISTHLRIIHYQRLLKMQIQSLIAPPLSWIERRVICHSFQHNIRFNLRYFWWACLTIFLMGVAWCWAIVGVTIIIFLPRSYWVRIYMHMCTYSGVRNG